MNGLLALVCVFALAGCGKSQGDLIASAKDYLKKGDAKAATIQLKNLLQKSPDSGEGRFLLGKALLLTGDLPGAEIELNRALEYKYSDEAVAPQLAKVLLGTRQDRKLIDQYAATEVADVNDAVELKVALALAYLAENSADEARSMVDRALKLAPDSEQAQVANARVLASLRDVDGALKALNDYLARKPDAALALQLKGDLMMASRTGIDNDAAADVYRKAIAARPDLPDAHVALITMAFAKGDIEGAAKQVAELKKVAPNHPQTRFMEAKLAFAQNDFKKARDLMQQLLRVAPNNVGMLLLAGATEMKLNSATQAEGYLGRALKVAPGFVAARRLLARVYLGQRLPDKALEVLKPMLASAKVDSETLSLAGQAAMAKGDLAAGHDFFARANKLAPEDNRVRAALALTELAKGNSDAAFSELQSIAAADKGTAVDMAVVGASLRRGDTAAALKAVDTVEKKMPDSAVPHQMRGQIFMIKKDMAAARKSFELALAKDKKYLPALGALASLDLMDKKPDVAKARYEALLKDDPKNVRALMAMSQLTLRSGGSRADARKLLNAAVQADPSDPAPRLVLIESYMTERDVAGAKNAAQAATAALPYNTDLLDRLGRVQIAGGDTQQAVSTFNKLISINPASPDGYIGLARAQIAAKDLDGAAKTVRKAAEAAPGSADVQQLSMVVAMQQKRPRDAVAIAREMQTAHPADAGGFMMEGEIEFTQKNWDGAIAAFRKASTKTDAGNSPARLHQSLLLAGRESEATKFANGWAAEHPKDAQFKFYLGDLALAQRDLPLAEKRYQEVLGLMPDHALALNNVA
ncbi:MAG: PEP-CTERM system TPR-repeat protein PrsT, partial [Burkholderiales bacterium]|nr:PEP-CTERM system TPR-repeat protein PrsT [Burkholderiales bacterium]